MIGIVPCMIGGPADEMMLGQGKRLRVTVAKEYKQADRRCCEEEKRQDDK